VLVHSESGLSFVRLWSLSATSEMVLQNIFIPTKSDEEKQMGSFKHNYCTRVAVHFMEDEELSRVQLVLSQIWCVGSRVSDAPNAWYWE
jgi:hypothetical protein